MAMLQFATLFVATVFAAVVAVAIDWLLLRTAFALMRPATAQRVPVPADLARETERLVRAFGVGR
jgi:hypothetical protein